MLRFTVFDLQKLIHTSTDPLSSSPFLYQTSHLLLLLPVADANSETLLLHLKDQAGCWRIQADCGVVLHNIWTNVTAWLSSLMVRLHGYSLSVPSLVLKRSDMLMLIPRYPFLLQLIWLCKSGVFLSLSLCSHISPPPNQASKPTQQITNWCLACEAVLCFPLAEWVVSFLCAQWDYYHHRCWSQYRSRELLTSYA